MQEASAVGLGFKEGFMHFVTMKTDAILESHG